MSRRFALNAVYQLGIFKFFKSNFVKKHTKKHFHGLNIFSLYEEPSKHVTFTHSEGFKYSSDAGKYFGKHANIENCPLVKGHIVSHFKIFFKLVSWMIKFKK